MGLKYYFGGSGAGKSYHAYQDIIQRSLSEPKTNFLVIVPDQYTMQTQKDLVCLHPNHGIMNIDVLSFGRLAHRIFDNQTLNKTVLDDTGKSLVLRLIAGKCMPELTVIGNHLNKIGYIHEVKSSLSEFMQYGIGYEELLHMMQECDNRKALQGKLKDLSVLYRAFTDYIQERFITAEETLDVLADMIPKAKLVQGSVILLDGFTGFTPVQMRVIRELLLAASQVNVTILAGSGENIFESADENDLFALSRKTVADLNRMASELSVSREPDVVLDSIPVYRHRDNQVMAHLEENLFRAGEYPYHETQHVIEITENQNPREEIQGVCRKLKTILMEEGCCYRDIALVTGDLSQYAPFIEEEFTKCEIPYFMDQTSSLVLNPFIEYIRSGLQIVLRDFNYDAVFHFLRSGFSKITREEADQLDNYVVALGIRGKNRYSTLFTRHSKESKHNAELLQQLNTSREKLMESLSPLLNKEKTAGDCVKALYEFIILSGAEEQLKQYASRFEEQGDYVKAKEYEQIYVLVMQLLEQIYSLLQEEEMTWKEFSEILDAGLGEIKVGTIPQSVDKVVIGDMERTRLNQNKVLFFVGVNDGIIPTSSGKGGIISDIDRELLCSRGWEMAPSPRQKMYIQRLYLYMNMTKPTEHLFLSYAKMDGGGKSIRPSYLIHQIQKLFPDLSIQKMKEMENIALLMDSRKAREVMAGQLREYAAGSFEQEEQKMSEFLTLYRLMLQQEEELNSLTEMAFMEKKDAVLSKKIASLVYGKVLENSVSRLEKYAACAYSHFLQYGLSLEEREEYGFESRDMGNIYHAVIQYFSEGLGRNNYSWLDFPKEFGEKLLGEAVEACTADYSSAVLYSSERNRYVIDRLKRILNRTVFSLQKQAKSGAFKPEGFELSFSQISDLDSVKLTLSEDEKMYLRGRIDRIDTVSTEGKVYVKVIDYKSGKKDIDLVMVYHGLSLQLVAYMNAAMEYERKKHPDQEVVPAALLYYQVEDPLVDGTGIPETEIMQSIQNKIDKDLTMTGVVNGDGDICALLDRDLKETRSSTVIPVALTKSGEYKKTDHLLSTATFQTISEYVDYKMKHLGKEIMDGRIERDPYVRSQTDACTYCTFKGACGYDENLAGGKRRPLEMNQEECIHIMKEDLA